MKNTTRILTLALAVVMLVGAVFCFASCGAKDDAKATLKMGTNAYFPPYEYYEGGAIVGIDAEIAAKIAEKIGMELEIVDMEFDSIITSVETDVVDMGMAGMTVTDERLLQVDFTSSYATGIQVVIVKEGSPITTVDDLFAEGASYKVGVQLGTTGDLYAGWDLGEENVVKFDKGADAVEALKIGDVDLVLIDNEPAKSFVAANTGLVILDTAYAVEEYAIAIKKGNTDLLNKINTALEELIADGTVASIVAKYIPAN